MERKVIYQGEDTEFIFNCLNEGEPLDERVMKNLDFGCCLYTNKWDPILMSTMDGFGNKTFENGLVQLVKEGAELKGLVPFNETSKLKPGFVQLEVMVRFPAGWRTIGIYEKICEVLPCHVKNFDFEQ